MAGDHRGPRFSRLLSIPRRPTVYARARTGGSPALRRRSRQQLSSSHCSLARQTHTDFRPSLFSSTDDDTVTRSRHPEPTMSIAAIEKEGAVIKIYEILPNTAPPGRYGVSPLLGDWPWEASSSYHPPDYNACSF
jgi:hypothetical protein